MRGSSGGLKHPHPPPQVSNIIAETIAGTTDPLELVSKGVIVYADAFKEQLARGTGNDENTIRSFVQRLHETLVSHVELHGAHHGALHRHHEVGHTGNPTYHVTSKHIIIPNYVSPPVKVIEVL